MQLVSALQPALQGTPMMKRSGSSGDINLRIFERGDAAGNMFRSSPALRALPRASGACKKSQRRRRRERRRGSTTRHVSLSCSRTAKKGKGSTKTLSYKRPTSAYKTYETARLAAEKMVAECNK